MEKLSRSVRRAKQVKILMLTGQAVQLTFADRTVLMWHMWQVTWQFDDVAVYD